MVVKIKPESVFKLRANVYIEGTRHLIILNKCWLLIISIIILLTRIF